MFSGFILQFATIFLFLMKNFTSVSVSLALKPQTTHHFFGAYRLIPIIMIIMIITQSLSSKTIVKDVMIKV